MDSVCLQAGKYTSALVYLPEQYLWTTGFVKLNNSVFLNKQMYARVVTLVGIAVINVKGSEFKSVRQS